MKKILTLLAAWSIASATFAQTGGVLTGKITSEMKPIELATVAVLHAADSSQVKMEPSGKGGDYEIKGLPGGFYLVKVSAVGYKVFYSSPIEVKEGKAVVPAIELVAATKALQDVVVTSKKAMIEQRPGKTILNVDAAPSNSGLSALDLLEKVPGVSVDKDGNISVRGKQGVMVLIDGKPTYLSTTDLVNMLKNMQSNSIDQVEVMTNPPAKYDAAGNSGIINLKTKKLNTRGTNGSVTTSYSQGIYGRTNNNINLNHRNNKLNVFGSYGFNRYEGFNDLVITRRFYQQDKTTLAGSADQVSHPHFSGYNHNVKAGADYFFSKKDVLGIVVNGNFSHGMEDPESVANVRDAHNNILYSLKSQSDNNYRFRGITSNVNYKHSFDSAGREITADIDFANYNKTSNTLMKTYTYGSAGNSNLYPVSLRGYIPSDINIYSAKIDYVHPLSKTTKLEAGAKSSVVRTDNRVDYTRSTGGSWFEDDRSNHFIYNENINAAYATISSSKNKWNFSAGLRIENTNAKGEQVKNDSSFTRQYTNLFPNIGIGFEPAARHNINLSYSRRIDRPDYDDLNPFTFFLDSLTYGQGNPYLQPQITNNIEVSHTFNKFLTTTVHFSQTDDVITQLLKQDTERKVTFQTRENVSKRRQYGLTVMFNKPVTKWWSTNVFVNASHNHYIGFYQADPIDIKFVGLNTNISNNFTFGKGWGAELSGFYLHSGGDGLLVANSLYNINAGVSKQVLNKKGNVRLSIRDIFYSHVFSGSARYSDVDVNLQSRRDSRQVNLSFTYRFGKNNIAPARRRTGGAGDEQNRVKSGGNG